MSILKRRIHTVAWLALCLTIGAAARAQDSDVLRATLSNGLQVIIVRNRLAPVVSTSVNYLVGSVETPEGFPGTAHAQEHMMFRGSPGLSADQLAAIGGAMGGEFNANTREGLTQYLYTVPAEDLDVALHIEAVRMRGVTDAQAAWEHERGAIEQEVAQDMSNPEYVLYEKIRSWLFSGTPYEHDALGTRASFNKTTAAMLKQFYDTWYAPNNAILIVVGDLDPSATLATIKQLFGDIERKKLPERPQVKLQPARATSISVNTDHPNGTQMLAIRMPGLESPDFPALEVLSDVLDSQRFALYGLVPEGKALNAQFGLDPMQRASVGYAVVSFTAGTEPETLDSEVRDILASVKKNGVPAELVEAAKQKERRQAEFQKNSVKGLASVWAEAVAVYGLESPEEDLARIEKVTVADVNRVARKYLDLDHAVSATLIPSGSGKPVRASASFGGQETIALGEAPETELPDWAQKALGRLTVPAWPIQPVVSTLPNGLTLIVQPENVSDTVSVYGHIENRPQVEVEAGKEGVAEILGGLFDYGSEGLDRLAFQKALDEIGAQEQAGADFSVKVLSGHFDRGVELLADNLLRPALPEKAFEVLRSQFAQVVAARNGSPSYLMSRSLRAGLFPKDDPSLREATPETVRALTPEDVQRYYDYAFRPDLADIVVIGNVSPTEAKATIEKYFGRWSATGPKPPTDLPAAPRNPPSAIAVPDASRVQDSVVLAETFPLTRGDPEYYPLELGNAVLGGGFYSSRLSVDLRKNSGLVYSIGSQLQAGKTRTVYFVGYACDPQNVSKAADIIARHLANMQTQPVPEDELTRVKALVLRQIPLAESSVSEIAHGLIRRSGLGLPLDEPVIAARRYIDLTPSDVQDAFQKWIRPDGLVRVTQGPEPQ
jgi:zinc protease